MIVMETATAMKTYLIPPNKRYGLDVWCITDEIHCLPTPVDDVQNTCGTRNDPTKSNETPPRSHMLHEI